MSCANVKKSHWAIHSPHMVLVLIACCGIGQFSMSRVCGVIWWDKRRPYVRSYTQRDAQPGRRRKERPLWEAGVACCGRGMRHCAAVPAGVLLCMGTERYLLAYTHVMHGACYSTSMNVHVYDGSPSVVLPSCGLDPACLWRWASDRAETR
jgi:hypothetical protein